jgi:transcriptional regulator with XRE-family HTH domain
MSVLGDRLKECRKKCGLSLEKVTQITGITDSRLSRMERGQINCTPDDLKKLARLYNIQLIPLYVMAGYLTEDDIKEYQLVFRGVSSLNDEEKQLIQSHIDLLNKKGKVGQI